MSSRQLTSARAVAAEVLRRCDPTRGYAGPILDRLLSGTGERQRATDLVCGTLRNLQAIDAVITRLSGRRIERIAPPLLSILRIGVYELVYHPATPAYSIVDEAAEHAASTGGKKQTGFVNAVLRGVERHIVSRRSPLSPENPRRTLIQDTATGCQFDVDLLPDPAGSPADYYSTCFSLPSWLVTGWLDRFGLDRTRDICLACNRRPSLYVRANTLRTTARDLLARFEQAGVKAEAVPSRLEQALPADSLEGHHARDDAEMLRIAGPHLVTQLPGFGDGLFTVQDLSACQAARVLQPQPGWRILDLCAAPGTKTTQLAEMTRDAAHIVATDVNPKRLERVQENVTRLGLHSVTIVPYAQLDQATTGPFDAILLDVPCSNTGVLARRIEARFRVRPETVEKLAAGQRDLLHKAAALLKPGGRICYSTCSIEQTENQQTIQHFLTTHDQFTLAHEQLTLPATAPADHDGAYNAVLQM